MKTRSQYLVKIIFILFISPPFYFTFNLLFNANIEEPNHASNSGLAKEPMTRRDTVSIEAQKNPNVAHPRVDYKFKHIDEQIEKLLISKPNIMITDGSRITAHASELLDLDTKQLLEIENTLSRSKSNLVIEYKSRLYQVDNIEPSVECYRVDAFPERAREIQDQTRSEIALIAGVKIAELTSNALLANPSLLGFGMNDLHFQVFQNSSVNALSDKSGWLIKHAELLPGSDDVVSKNVWNAEDFARICNIFSME
jgi:hypothetical protein